MLRAPFLACLLCAVLPGGALAATTGWVEIGPGSRVRLISDGMLAADGSTRLGIEIELAAGFRTYWRVPGEAGLPLGLDLTGSIGVADAQLSWPFPERQMIEGVLEYVYLDQVVLPLRMVPESGAERLAVHAALTLGVCSDICIPARAEFNLPVDVDEPDRVSSFRLDSAMALVPVLDATTPPLFGSLAPAQNGTLLVQSWAPGPVAASLIVDGRDPGWLFGSPQNGPHSDLLELLVLAGGDVSELVGEVLRLTFMTDRGPFELTRVVGPLESVDSVEKVE
ncbi:MAG: protein-disulfide reductase DsbD domain-containing protein [Cucumibacter sp.]